MTFFSTPVSHPSGSSFEPLPPFPTPKPCLNVPSWGFPNSHVRYHCLFTLNSLNRPWTQWRQQLGIFLGPFRSWHRCWHLVSTQSVFEQTSEGVKHGIKFTCDICWSRGWKTFGMPSEWEGYFLLFREKIKGFQSEKRPPYGFYCHLSFFSHWLKIKKERVQNNLRDWQNCEKTVKPYF